MSDVSAWRVAKRFRRPASTTERLVGYTRGRTRDTAWAGVRATQCRSVSHRCPSLSCALWKSARAKRNPAIFVTLAGRSIVLSAEDGDGGPGRRRRHRAGHRGPPRSAHAAYKIIAPIRYNEKTITVPYRIRLYPSRPTRKRRRQSERTRKRAGSLNRPRDTSSASWSSSMMSSLTTSPTTVCATPNCG